MGKILVFFTALCCLCLPKVLWASPTVPEIVAHNGLIYCTHSSGFSFNPQSADAGTSMNVVTEQIYNKLFETQANSSKVQPSLAKSYDISEDGKFITITLRQGVKFQHTPWFTPSRDFNADDVVFSLNRVLGHNTSLPEFSHDNSENANPQYQIYHELAKKSRFPYFESIKLNQKIKSVQSLNPYQVQIELFQPDASVLSHLASQYAVMLSLEYALQLNADDNLIQLDQLPVGTGAYQVQNYFRSQYIRLKRNPYYWQTLPQIENVVIDLSTDRTGRLAKLFNQECQIAAFPELSQLGLLNQSGLRFQANAAEGMNLAFLAFNFLKPSLQDKQTRYAIAKAINRERLIQHIYYDTAQATNHIIPAVSWASSNHQMPAPWLDYDPETARKMLENKDLTLQLWVIDEEQIYNPSPIKMAEMIKFDLAQVGIKVKVRSISRHFLMKNLQDKSEDYDLILSGWLAGSLDPDSFLRPILSCNSTKKITNLANWCDPQFDQLLDVALISQNANVRAADYAQAQQKILEELPIFPLANVNRVLISNTQVKGIEMTPFGNIHFEKLRLEQGEK